MKRPGKKDIKAAVDALKGGPDGLTDGPGGTNSEYGKLSDKKTSKKIRKQGI